MNLFFVGVIKEIDDNLLTVTDKRTNIDWKVIMNGLNLDQAKVGLGGLFFGELREVGSQKYDIIVTRYELRKILEPLHEEDLFAQSGKYTLLAPIEDPFPQAYLDKQREERERELDLSLVEEDSKLDGCNESKEEYIESESKEEYIEPKESKEEYIERESKEGLE